MQASPKITLIDDLHPEDTAMLQALQSRSPASVQERLQKVKKSGSGQFMDKFYVGYGHKSIGDCGSVTIFIEGVSMLCAKAIQDWPLYSGQEASTRYMDFSQAEFNNPLAEDPSLRTAGIQLQWLKFYLDAQEPVLLHLSRRYPQGKESSALYARALKARAFDTLRCFLPAGVFTNLSWHTNLRQAADHLEGLLVHPDVSVRAVAEKIWSGLVDRYPRSFKRTKPEISAYMEQCASDHFLRPEQSTRSSSPKPGLDFHFADFTQNDLKSDPGLFELLINRPRGAPVPRRAAAYGRLGSRFLLDFGSYRDLQRHRNGLIRMPLLTTEFGFHNWYIEELPDNLRAQAVDLIESQTECINALDCDEFTRQNYCAMGFQVPCEVTQNLPAFVYRLELRSSKTVHPTLRLVVHEEIAAFREQFPDIPIYVDEDEDSWTVRRGGQTIEEISSQSSG